MAEMKNPENSATNGLASPPMNGGTIEPTPENTAHEEEVEEPLLSAWATFILLVVVTVVGRYVVCMETPLIYS